MKVYFPATVVLLCAAFANSGLTGCSSGASFPDAGSPSTGAPSSDFQTVLRGNIHGGQQPIVGASIYLLAAGTTGYGSSATSLLTNASDAGYPTQVDGSSRYYATTDSGGNFQIVDACTPGQQVYIASVGGNAGSGTNSAANEIAILGQCPAAGNFDSTLTGVYVSEISTVAGAYSASAYAVNTFDVGSPNTPLALTGIANAFANSANLFNIEDVNDVARTHTLSGSGVAPQTKVHTLANILAACINSAGPASPACSTLFVNAKTAGTTGIAPSDVATAAMNIAHNPWANVSALFDLQSPSSPFSPQLSSAPSDFSLALSFPGAALANHPSLAIDGSGNVWTVVPNSTAVTEISPTGRLLSGSTGFAIGGGFANARGMAFDINSNLWVLGEGVFTLVTPAATFAELNDSGTYQQILDDYNLTATYSEPPASTTNFVVDGSGSFYYGGVQTSLLTTSTSCCSVKYTPGTSTVTDLNSGFAPSGAIFLAVSKSAEWTTGYNNTLSEGTQRSSSTLTAGGLSAAAGVALDQSGNAWVANSGDSSISEFNNSGIAVSGTSGFTGGGLATPTFIAIDGLSNAWTANYSGGSLSEFTSAGTAIGTGFTDTSLSNPSGLAADPSGNLWVANATSTAVTEFIGIASPVVTPTASAIGNNELGSRP